MMKLAEELQGVKSAAIAGHVRPDGDCAGSCMAVYNYIREQYPEMQVTVYLEPLPERFLFLKGTENICSDCSREEKYDLFIALDCGDKGRLGEAARYFDTAARTICIDHHISNVGFAEKSYIVPEASSTCELVYDVLEEDRISEAAAEALYLGIVHDTGVFQYSCTSEKTMQIAGRLMSKGVEFTKIIDDTYYTKTYVQNQIMGRAMLESIMILDNRCIVSRVTRENMRFYGVTPKDLDGIVNQLRATKGVEVAIFLYESGNQEYKVSMRSNGPVDVSAICTYFGGGGHVKAAGCTMHGSIYDVINNLSLHVEKQLKENESD